MYIRKHVGESCYWCVIAFDEYHVMQWAGEKIAVDEFLKNHKQISLKDTYTNYHYIIKKHE